MEEEHLVPQVLFNALAQGSAYCLLAIPVTLLYRQRGFLDFSLAGVFALSAYACLMLKPLFAGYVPFCIVVGATSGIICTAVLEYAVFAPMHSRRGDSGPLLLMSLGLFICIEAILALSFGYETVLLRNTGKDISLTVWGARLSGPQAIQVMTLVVVTGAVLGLLYATRAGRMVRAAAADEELASVTGIPVSSVRLCLAASCGVIAGVGGALGGLDVDLTPGMGLFPFFYALAAVIIGGTGSVGGAVLAAFMLTLITNTSSMFFGSYWQDASAFVILAGFLLLRPQGFFGKQVKSATV
jgi:branched-chain amino acid transport system permease protein